MLLQLACVAAGEAAQARALDVGGPLQDTRACAPRDLLLSLIRTRFPLPKPVAFDAEEEVAAATAGRRGGGRAARRLAAAANAAGDADAAPRAPVEDAGQREADEEALQALLAAEIGDQAAKRKREGSRSDSSDDEHSADDDSESDESADDLHSAKQARIACTALPSQRVQSTGQDRARAKVSCAAFRFARLLHIMSR
jgi:hypothetical protein